MTTMDLRDVLAVVLGGGRGTRLYPLTKLRAKPAVPLAGKYRLIDVPLSNCLNSGIEKIYVLTQFLSASLHRHIHGTYKMDLFSGGFVHILAAGETATGMDWYEGTADAVRKNLLHLDDHAVEDTLILSGDHLYRMDYRKFIEFHREKRADVTVAVHPVTREQVPRFGILVTNEDGRVGSFLEKPTVDEVVGLESDVGHGVGFLGSMGVYVFRSGVLRDILLQSDAEDFGREVIPAAVESLRVYAFSFDDYWADIGTVRAFYEANLAITSPCPPFDFYDVHDPIYTRPRFLPPSRAIGCHLQKAVLAEGCLVQESVISESVIGLRSIIGPDVKISRTVMMGADFYETLEQKAENRRLGRPDVGVGQGTVIEGAIIDKNARIGRGVKIRPREDVGGVEEADNYVVRDGLVVIPKNTVIPDGTVI
jgi:glucose-1-phosphate adenylyltransferase